MLAVEQVVPVLHTRDVDDLPCPVELGDGDLGQPDQADLALILDLPRTHLTTGSSISA